MLKHLQPFANSETSLFALYCVRTVSKPLPPEPCCDGDAITRAPLAISGFFPRIQDQYSSARDVSRVAGYESQVVL